MKKILLLSCLVMILSAENNNSVDLNQSIEQKKIEINKKSNPNRGEVTHNGTTFYISTEIQTKYPELIKLILNTESMDDDERQYWFDIMPSMTESQVDRLYTILETEKKKLEELEVKYQKEIKSLNEKHLLEWQEFQLKKQQEKDSNASRNNYDEIIKKIKELKNG